jgi:hypothetical protein
LPHTTSRSGLVPELFLELFYEMRLEQGKKEDILKRKKDHRLAFNET